MLIKTKEQTKYADESINCKSNWKTEMKVIEIIISSKLPRVKNNYSLLNPPCLSPYFAEPMV